MTSEIEAASAPDRGAVLPVVSTAGTVDERIAATDPAAVLPAQLLLAQDRAAWLGRRLADQVEAEGLHGIVGDAYAVTLDGRAVRTGEFGRVLFEQEARERDRVSALAEKIAKLDLGSVRQAHMVDVGRWLTQGVKTFAEEMGFDLDDPRVQEAAVRAMTRLAAQRREEERARR